MHEIAATIQCECGDVAVVECQIISPVAGEVFSVPVQQPGGMITVPLGTRSDLKPGEVVAVRVTISKGNSFVANCVVPAEAEPNKLVGFTLSGQKTQEAADTRNPVYRLTASLTAEVHSGSASVRVQMISPFAGEELVVSVNPTGIASLSLGDLSLQSGEEVIAAASMDGGNSLQAAWAAPEEVPPEPEPDQLLSLNISGVKTRDADDGGSATYQVTASVSARVNSEAAAVSCQIISPFAGQDSTISLSPASPSGTVSLGSHKLDPGEEVIVVATLAGGNNLQASWIVPKKIGVDETPGEDEDIPTSTPTPSEAPPPPSTPDSEGQRDAIRSDADESRKTSTDEQKDPGGIKVELGISKATLRGDGKDFTNAKVIVTPVEAGDQVSVTEVFFELLWEHRILGGHETRSYLGRKYLQMVGNESTKVTAPFTKWDGKLLLWAWVTTTVTSSSGASAERKGSASARIPVAGANPKLTLQADQDTIDLDGSSKVTVQPSLMLFGEPSSNFEISTVAYARKLFVRENEQDLKRLVLQSKFHLEDEAVKAYRGSPARISCSVRLTDTISEHYTEIPPENTIDINPVPCTILFDPADPDSLPTKDGLFRTRLRGKVVSGSSSNRPISGEDIKRDRPEGAFDDWRFEFTFDRSESGLPEAWHSFNLWPSLPEDVKECTVQDVSSNGEIIFLNYDRGTWKPAGAPPPVEPPIPTDSIRQPESRSGSLPPVPPPKQISEVPPAIRTYARPWKPTKVRPSRRPYFEFDHGEAFYDHSQGFLNGQGSTIQATFHADGVRFEPVKFKVWPPCKLFAYVDEGFRSKEEAGGSFGYIFQVGHAYLGLFEEAGTGILAGCFEVNNLPIGTAELRNDGSHEFDMRRGWDITKQQYREALMEIKRWKVQCDRKEMWYNMFDIKGGAIDLPFTGKGNCASFVDAVFRAAVVPVPFAADLPVIDVPLVGESVGPYGYLLTRPGTLANAIRYDVRTEHHPKKDATEFEDNWPYKDRRKYYRRLLGLASVVDKFSG